MKSVGATLLVTPYIKGEKFEDVDHVKVEVTNTDYGPEPIQEVDDVTVEVGALRGSTVMP